MPNYLYSSIKTIADHDADIKKGNIVVQEVPDVLKSPRQLSYGNVSNLANVVFKLGEKGSSSRQVGAVQDFHLLKEKCLTENILFEDPEFPAIDSSVYGLEPAAQKIEWKRPKEIECDPKLFVKGVSRFDVKQGNFGDCWVLAALANISMHHELFHRVVPKDQGFEKKNYAGIFHFRFWQYGRWVDVVIDDRLPCINGQLMGLHSAENNEFWSPLVEKAYAKLHGSYQALEGGNTGDAMEDFTGGLAEIYDSDEVPKDFFDILLKAHEKNSLMGCSFQKNIAKDGLQGLYEGHAYSITQVKCVKKVKGCEEKIPLLRVRNPWGTSHEWTGSWSDKCSKWKSLTEKERKALDLKFDHDGEFWISFGDFKDLLSDIEICYLNSDFLFDSSDKREWEISAFEGEWVRGASAGGCTNDLETFQYNPQYRITLEKKSAVIVALTQKNRRDQGKKGVDFLHIGISIYLLNEDSGKKIPKPLDLSFFQDSDNEELDITTLLTKSAPICNQFANRRQVSCRITLSPGSYCIIPNTFEADQEGEFLLRVFSDKPHSMEEYDGQVGIDEVDNLGVTESWNDKTRQEFRGLAGDDFELDWMEEKNILDTKMHQVLHNKGFSKDIARNIVALLDTNRSGKVGFHEFRKLWQDLKKLKRVFKEFTSETNEVQADLSTYQLRKALGKAGFHLDNRVLNRFVRRYATEDKKITFEDFVMCALRLKAILGSFKESHQNPINVATFTLDEWLDTTLNL